MEKVPILFEEIFIKDFESKRELISPPIYATTESHLYILVHGFEGCYFDLKIVRDNISLAYPSASFLLSRCNEGKTSQSIYDSGFHLSQEIIAYINQPNSPYFTRISFIGQSLGGLIVRSSLQHLEIYKEKISLFISLSSPHLGCLYGTSKLVDAGRWVLSKMKKNKSLQQLSLKDNDDPRRSYVYKLADDKCIS